MPVEATTPVARHHVTRGAQVRVKLLTIIRNRVMELPVLPRLASFHHALQMCSDLHSGFRQLIAWSV